MTNDFLKYTDKAHTFLLGSCEDFGEIYKFTQIFKYLDCYSMNMQTLLRINVYSKDKTRIPLHPVTNRSGYTTLRPRVIRNTRMCPICSLAITDQATFKLTYHIRRGAFTNRMGNVVKKTNSVKIAAKNFVTIF